ncbi:hypothetical protein [Dongia sp.]|uniref:hypothetical protein n=1 Tax=Dongia sp. TaxID=1977262 RepID=UPI0035B1BD89
MRLKLTPAYGAIALPLLVALAIPVAADSGQLRDPTRCGQGNANCRNLPPSANDRPSNEQRPPSRDQKRNVGEKPGLMRTSPLPSEGLQRNTESPGSTGLDKGSTGISQPPRKRISH